MKEATTAKINKTLCPVLSITSAFLFILYNIIENSIKWSLKNWRVHSFPAVIVEPNSMKTDSSLLARTQTKKKPYTLRLLQPSLLFFFFFFLMQPSPLFFCKTYLLPLLSRDFRCLTLFADPSSLLIFNKPIFARETPGSLFVSSQRIILRVFLMPYSFPWTTFFW